MAAQPLIVIVGPTASGKSELALRLAERYGGEIVCADSRTVYEGLDIGTAKPSVQDQQRVKHHLLDVVRPTERFTAHDFQQQSQLAIASIRQRGNIPFLVGGTGLYVDGVVYDFVFVKDDDDLRSRLDGMPIDLLKSMLKDQHKPLPVNHNNRLHLVNALLRTQPSVKKNMPKDTYIVGITTQKEILHGRITARINHMFDDGIVDEAQKLAEMYGWGNPAMTGNIYPIVQQYLSGHLSKQQAIERAIITDRQLVKRQLTWFKRNPDIAWHNLDGAEQYISAVLDRTEH